MENTVEWIRNARNAAALSQAEVAAPIHDRMPVIVRPELYEAWLDTNTNAADVASLLKPYTPAEMDTYRVSTLVNNPRNNVRKCVEAVA